MFVNIRLRAGELLGLRAATLLCGSSAEQPTEHLQAGEGELGWLTIYAKFCDN